jgi:hypothetical protein
LLWPVNKIPAATEPSTAQTTSSSPALTFYAPATKHSPQEVVSITSLQANDSNPQAAKPVTALQKFSPIACYFISLSSKYSLQHPVLNVPPLKFETHGSHSYKMTGNIIFTFSEKTGSEMNDKNHRPSWNLNLTQRKSSHNKYCSHRITLSPTHRTHLLTQIITQNNTKFLCVRLKHQVLQHEDGGQSYRTCGAGSSRTEFKVHLKSQPRR